MGSIFHVCNWFDPAADLVRCVAELKKHSRHQHELVVADPHIGQHFFAYQLAELMKWNTDPDLIEYLFDWCDGVLYHHKGWEDGWHRLGKPQAYRNVCIFYDNRGEKYWTMPKHNCKTIESYKLLASSHLGAEDYLPGCRFLPDLIPIYDALYTPDFSERPHCVSYIKVNIRPTRLFEWT